MFILERGLTEGLLSNVNAPCEDGIMNKSFHLLHAVHFLFFPHAGVDRVIREMACRLLLPLYPSSCSEPFLPGYQ